MGVVGRIRRATGSDEALLDCARQGDSACFDELYRRYKAAVLGYCLVRLSDRQAAEDATQEVFLKAYNSAGAPVGNVRAWLFTVARNVVIDAARRRLASPVHVELQAAVETATAAVDQSEFSAMDVATNVFIALRRLPARQRRAMILRDFQDKSSQQIADELEMRPGSVDVLICRARAGFGRAYDEVSEMSFACRQTTEAIYRESGSGVTERQRQLVDVHLATCPRCRAEHARAHSPRFLAGLVPWLWMRLDAMGLTDMANRLRMTGGPIVAGLDRLQPQGLSATAKAALGVAVTAAILAPGVAVKMADVSTPEARTFKSALAGQGSRPTTRKMPEGSLDEAASSNASGAWHDSAKADEFEHAGMKAHPKAMDEGEHGTSASDSEHTGSSWTLTDATSHTGTSTHAGLMDTGTWSETHSGSVSDSHDSADEPH